MLGVGGCLQSHELLSYSQYGTHVTRASSINLARRENPYCVALSSRTSRFVQVSPIHARALKLHRRSRVDPSLSIPLTDAIG